MLTAFIRLVEAMFPLGTNWFSRGCGRLRQYGKGQASSVGRNRSAAGRASVEADDTIFVRAEVAHT
jgi:hypothetical protein